ncbi:hypothetical protein ABF236_003433 [Yersinia ruckeri]
MYATQDLIITENFTLPETPSRAQLERALAHFGGFTEVKALPNGRILLGHFRGKYTNKYLILADGDDRSPEKKKTALKEASADFIFDPLDDPMVANLIIDYRLCPQPYIGRKCELVGTWRVSTKKVEGGFDMPDTSLIADEIQIQECYEGYSLRETACRAVLGLNGRFKDVYYYYSEKHGTLRNISLNEQQKAALINKTSFEAFHRRLIWFPKLAKYSYALNSALNIDPELLKRVEAKALKAIEDRKQYTNKEDFFDFLDNYCYKNKGLFDKNRLNTGVIYVTP